jgi:CNT family concentrative nucleoside transporter
MATLIAIAWVFSARRAHVNWKVVGIGLAFQLVLALLRALRTLRAGRPSTSWARIFVKVLDFTKDRK